MCVLCHRVCGRVCSGRVQLRAQLVPLFHPRRVLLLGLGNRVVCLSHSNIIVCLCGGAARVHKGTSLFQFLKHTKHLPCAGTPPWPPPQLSARRPLPPPAAAGPPSRRAPATACVKRAVCNEYFRVCVATVYDVRGLACAPPSICRRQPTKKHTKLRFKKS